MNLLWFDSSFFLLPFIQKRVRDTEDCSQNIRCDGRHLKFTSQRISFGVHWGWFLLLSSLSGMTEPVKEPSWIDEREAGEDLDINARTAVGAAWTHSVWAVCPGYRPVHHPGDACLLASMCQHLANSLTRRHTLRGSELLLHCPLLGWTGEHRDRGTAGEHLCRHMLLGARKLQPEEMQDRIERGRRSPVWGRTIQRQGEGQDFILVP